MASARTRFAGDLFVVREFVIPFEAGHAEQSKGLRKRQQRLTQCGDQFDLRLRGECLEKHVEIEETLGVLVPRGPKRAHMLAREVVRRTRATGVHLSSKPNGGTIRSVVTVDARGELFAIHQPLRHSRTVDVLDGPVGGCHGARTSGAGSSESRHRLGVLNHLTFASGNASCHQLVVRNAELGATCVIHGAHVQRLISCVERLSFLHRFGFVNHVRAIVALRDMQSTRRQRVGK